MGEKTGISWTDHTWNPWVGCHRVSEGCRHCYMYREQERRGIDPMIVRRTSPATFNALLNSRKWKPGSKVFVNSYSDFLISEADAWRPEAWAIIRRRPDLIFQIVTKRPNRFRICLPEDWGTGWPNVWLGVTIEDWRVSYRWDELLEVPAAVRWISWEPALSAFPFRENMVGKLDWLVSGGESGPVARPAEPLWFEYAVAVTRLGGTPLFHKQNGGNVKIDGAWGGDLIQGKRYHEFPIVTVPAEMDGERVEGEFMGGFLEESARTDGQI